MSKYGQWKILENEFNEYLEAKIPEVSVVTRNEIATFMTGKFVINFYTNYEEFIHDINKRTRPQRYQPIEYYKQDT